MELTIGMASYQDFDGVYFTLQSLRLYQDLQNVELLVVDNYGCNATRDFVENWAKGRYLLWRDTVGTAAPRDRVFHEARGEAVLCLDCHVLLEPGVIARLKRYYREHPDSLDLLQGPLVYDDLKSVATHFDPVWRDQMWGIWGVDERGLDREAEPFEIPMQGLGLFSCRKAAWPGFNPRFRSFGGEEGYIHQKFRNLGRRCLCLPWLRWVHRFARPGGVRSPLSLEDKIYNYLVGHAEVGLDMKPIVEHFRNYLDPAALERLIESSRTPALSLEDAYTVAAKTPSDINEHVPTLKELASKCEAVVEFGVRTGVSTVGLLAGQPKRLISYDKNDSPQARALASVKGDTDFQFHVGDSLTVDLSPCDLLFIDTKHTADQLHAELTRHHEKVHKWIAMHDTEIFGERGEDGSPGLLPALRRFLKDHPEWTVIRHDKNNHGFTVISKDAGDKLALPSAHVQEI